MKILHIKKGFFIENTKITFWKFSKTIPTTYFYTIINSIAHITSAIIILAIMKYS